MKSIGGIFLPKQIKNITNVMNCKTRSNTTKAKATRIILGIGLGILFSMWGFIDETINFIPNALVSIIICVSTLHINVYQIMPKLLFQNRFVLYSISIISYIIIIELISWLLCNIISTKQIDQCYICRWALISILTILISTIYGYSSLDRISRKREIDLTHQNIEFEMKFLKSQINPHFLFNALNNIYALSVIKSNQTPDMILKLSDMLRFTLYDSESKKVKLGREIEYIINYIEFQKLKMDSEPNIHVETNNCNKEMLIEPMLLIPFIENSFKHGNIDNSKKGWLQVEIKTLGPILIFKVKNSLPAIAINKDIVGGIGVENVRKRLDILYPDRYELNIETTDTSFNVYMKIDTFAN